MNKTEKWLLISSLCLFVLVATSSGCVEHPCGDVTVVVDPEPPVVEPIPPAEPEFYFCKQSPTDLSDGCCTRTAFEQTSDPRPGMLMRGDGEWPMVYYLASNGKRYVFPNSATLISWHEPFYSEALMTGESDVCRNVVQVPQAVLAGIPIGGNVTFRPGSHVTGIDADPTRYVVGRGQRLIRLADPSLVDELYVDAPERLRLLPEAFFVNYVYDGETISSGTQYDAEALFYRACLEEELGIP